MIIKLLRYIQGYVGFLIIGAFPERFINFCSKNGMYIWGIKPTPKGYEGYTSTANYRQFPKVRRATKTRSRVISRNGLPFVLTKYNRRWGVWSGLTAAGLMLYILSTIVWSINVNGTQEIDDDSLKMQLAQLGLKPGAWKKSIDPSKMEMEMMLVEKRLAWIAINIQGSRVTVEVRERVIPPDRIDKANYAANVIASHTGQIKRMEVYDGQPMVTVGNTVVKGDIIVSGITIDKFQNTQLKHARAVVIAWVPERLEVSVPMVSQRITQAGDPIVYKRLVVGGFKLPLAGSANTYTDYTQQHTNKDLFGLDWLSYQTTTITPISIEEIPVSEFDAKEEAMRRLVEKEENIFGESSIVEKSLYACVEGQNFVLKGDYVIEKNIAMEVEILQD